MNGILFNSEVWYSVSAKQVANFVDIDKYLLRGLVNAHAKVPLEHLYLELSVLPLSYVLSVRRMIYLQTILKRHDTELTKQIYMSQKSNPLPGDWCNLVSEDFETIGLHISDEHIAQLNEADYKQLIRSKVRETALKHLYQLQEGHSKVRENIYNGLQKPTHYLINRKITYRQASIMFALRSKTLRGVKNNFKKMYSNNTLCWVCERCEDTQEHILVCKVLLNILPLKKHIEYNHMNGTEEQQVDFIQSYEKYLELRDELQEDPEEGPSLPGLYSGPVRPQAGSSGRPGRSDDASVG